MLIVSGHVQIDPATTDAAWALVEPCVHASRAEEGNLSYGFYADPTTPGLFRLYEEWVDRAAFEAHQASPHRNALFAAMGGLSIRSVEFTLHEVAATTKLM